MWDGLMVDSDEEYFESGEDRPPEVQKEAPPPGVTGLARAEHYFGPLSSPVAATEAKWAVYTEHRLAANAEYKNVFDRRKRFISDAVAAMETELGLDDGTLQRCVTVLSRGVYWDDDKPRSLEISVRIYSPTTPGYVDVHIKYHCLPRMYMVEWFHGLGYKIHNRACGPPTGWRNPSTDGRPSSWYSQKGWRTICWGYYDSDGNYGQDWREIEKGEVELDEEGVLDIHEVLFGPIDAPPSDDVDAVLEYRKRLVATVRLLFAAVGISYKVACTDGERDEGSYRFSLEGLSDRWVGRGIRAACGFQLSGDAEAARRGKEERIKEATRSLKDDNYDDDDDDDDSSCLSDDRCEPN